MQGRVQDVDTGTPTTGAFLVCQHDSGSDSGRWDALEVIAIPDGDSPTSFQVVDPCCGAVCFEFGPFAYMDGGVGTR